MWWSCSNTTSRLFSIRRFYKSTKCTKPGLFALTYDDGVYDFTQSLLLILKRNNVRATFFINAFNYGDITRDPYKSVLIQMHREGHQIASHTYDHLDIATLSMNELWSQMVRNDQAIKQIIGSQPVYFRPPFGSYHDQSLRALQSWGYKVVWKNIDNYDTQHEGDGDAMQKNQEFFDQSWNGSDPSRDSFISLQHDTIRETVEE